MNKEILINVKGYINKFINKCIKNRIDLKDINYLTNDEIEARINFKDYKKVKKLNYYSKIKIIDYFGFQKIEIFLKKNIYYLLMIIFCFILMDVITSFIVDIEIIHSSKEIRDLISQELARNGVKKYNLAISNGEISKLKEKIMDDNQTKIEWINISRDGMKYLINVESRIIKEAKENDRPRNIIANKDAEITNVISSKGEVLVRGGDYVKKGDVLISGQINLYENIKGLTAATGMVYGNVWYNVTMSLPKEQIEENNTGSSRINLIINNKILLNNKFKYYHQENIKELKILGLKIKIFKEVEYTKKVVKIKQDEADQIVLKKIEEEFNNKLKGNGKVISQKVLKKEENNSKIDYRIFVVVNELINNYEYLE